MKIGHFSEHKTYIFSFFVVKINFMIAENESEKIDEGLPRKKAICACVCLYILFGHGGGRELTIHLLHSH